MRTLPSALIAAAALAGALPSITAAQSSLTSHALERAAAVEPKVVAWRRDIHQHPELGNRETRTAALVADHLRALGLEVRTGVAHTGVVALLRGGRPGPVVLLRADMDALPVTERADVPFASTVKTEYAGEQVGVMHACGHDTHVAILMGVAEVLAGIRERIPGAVKFVFQPAEEGPPPGEQGGAKLMVEQGILTNPDVDAAFALHIDSRKPIGNLYYTSGPRYASSDDFRIVVQGRPTHGARPWTGVDPIVAAAHVVTALQTLVSRQMNLAEHPSVVTVGRIRGGVRNNIIAEQVEMLGTVRALHPDDRARLHEGIRRTAVKVAESMGASADVQVPWTRGYPVTVNDEALAAAMTPVLEAVAGADRVHRVRPTTTAEDFSFIAERVPGFYIGLGGRPADVKEEDAPDHHTPDFFIDDSGLGLGVRAMAAMALEYLTSNSRSR